MLIACTSDIHLDISDTNVRAISYLVDVLNDREPDVFVFAGDVSPDLGKVRHFFRELSRTSMPKVFVCGNHDIWVSRNQQRKGRNSYVKYYREIKGICDEYGIHYLSTDPVILSDVAFIGTIGWYNYSTRNEALDKLFSMKNYREKASYVGVWNDGLWAYWAQDWNETKSVKMRRFQTRMNDDFVAKNFCNDLAGQLQKVLGRTRQAVAVTHIVPFKELVRFTGAPSHDFFSAFIGNVELGKIILSSKVVTHAVCGHTHFPADTKINAVRCICSPIGYLDGFTGDLQKHVADRVKLFEV